MDKVIIHYHKQKKDKNGKVIGIEKLYVTKTLSLSIEQPLPVEVVMS